MYFFKSQAMECGHYILAVAIFGKDFTTLKSSVTTSERNDAFGEVNVGDHLNPSG